MTGSPDFHLRHVARWQLGILLTQADIRSECAHQSLEFILFKSPFHLPKRRCSISYPPCFVVAEFLTLLDVESRLAQVAASCRIASC